MPQFGSYPNAAALSQTDTVLALQAGAVKQATVQQIEAAVSDASRWIVVNTSNYTSAPFDDHTITMSDTTGLAKGLPLRLVTSAGTKYVIINAVASNSSVTVTGPLLSTDAISAMSVGKPEQVSDMNLFVAGAYATNATQTLMADKMETYYRWRAGQAHIVEACFVNHTADGTSAPKVNVLVNGTRVITDDSGLGVQVSSSGAWNTSTGVEITGVIDRNDTLELEVTVAGGDGDARELTATLTFVLD